MSRSSIFLGTSGWSYKDWIGPFYPKGTPAARYLPVYAQYFSSVEIDSTFYATPSERMIRAWYDRTPDHFIFAAKVPRAVTHDAELNNVTDEVLAFAEAMRLLKGKCGPLLFQFAPTFTSDRIDRLAALLPHLPTDMRWVVEVRHTSWLIEPFYDMLRAHNVALAHVDLPWMPRATPMTANFAYIRWLGDRRAIPEDFSFVRPQWARTSDLDWWARQIGRMHERGMDVFGYANNHYQGYSPATIRELQRRLNIPGSEPEPMLEQQQLF